MVINGATKDIGTAVIVAVSKARGMELAGAIDNRLVGQDAGEVSLSNLCSLWIFMILRLLILAVRRYVVWKRHWKFQF